MHILLVNYALHMPGVHSLKEKRGIIKPILNELRRDYNVSAAEVDLHDAWQEAAISIVTLGNDRAALEKTEREITRLLGLNESARVSEIDRQWL